MTTGRSDFSREDNVGITADIKSTRIGTMSFINCAPNSTTIGRSSLIAGSNAEMLLMIEGKRPSTAGSSVLDT